MIIDLFINAGWHTVPLEGKLERLEGGKKTLPLFEAEWKSKYAKDFNTKKARLAGALTGAKSGIIAIDCDNDLTYNLFRTFDNNYSFIFTSKGKPQGGGTIIYKYSDTISNFKLNTNEIALDFYSDDGFIYLPTEHNFTKDSWEGTEHLPELKEAPAEVLALLSAFKIKSSIATDSKENNSNVVISNRLAPMLEVFVKKGKYDPVLFKVITPYSFRDLPIYVTKGHLHPNDVPLGRGSEYLSKISAILGADISVNAELYTNTMYCINNLWDDPIEKKKLMATIINPMIEGRSNVNGEVIWKYDEHWEQMGFIATTLNGDYIESFYDDVKGLYYIVNYTVPYVRSFSDKRPVITTLKTVLGRTVTEMQYDSSKQLIRTMVNPSLEFGHIAGKDEFNMFRQTPELAIINSPEGYRTEYNRPNTILNYFNSLIPDDEVRSYVLSFLRTKFTTFNYSPIILYLIGKPGSGKDTLVNIIRQILGQEYVAKPDTRVFLEQFNGWMVDKFFIQLDEYGNKLTRSSDKEEVLGKLKAYTGAQDIQIRAMRQDGYEYSHSITFIMTANRNPLPIETDDRRVCFVSTPNKLEHQEWVKSAGGISQVQKLIKNEIMDFCYYLATEVKNLHPDAYVIAPLTEDKERLILDNLPAAEQIIYYVNNSRWQELLDLAEEYGIVDFHEEWENNKLMNDKMSELYDLMTDGAGSDRTLIKAMKTIGHSRSHSTRRGENVFYYYINDLHRFKPRVESQDFAETQTDKAVPEGIE